MATITITLDVDDDLDAKLAKARAVVRLLEEARTFIAELAGDAAGITPSTASGVRQTPARPTADRPPPRAVAETNGHGSRKPGRPSGSPATARRERRAFTDEQKQAGAARAREVGATKAAEEFDVVPTVVRGWLKKHPKEHAAGRINGTPPAVGESREDWETRKREAAGSSL